MLRNAGPLVLQFASTLSQLHPFDLIPNITIQHNNVTFSDQFGNILKISTENSGDQITHAYKSHNLPLKFPPGDRYSTDRDLVLNYKYETKVAELDLPKLSKSRILLAKRIHAAIKESSASHSEHLQDNQSLSIYQLYKNQHMITGSNEQHAFTSGQSETDGDRQHTLASGESVPTSKGKEKQVEQPSLVLNVSDSSEQQILQLDFNSTTSQEEKDKMMSEKAASFGEFVVKSARSFFMAEVSIVKSQGLAFASRVFTYMPLLFRPLKTSHEKISCFNYCGFTSV